MKIEMKEFPHLPTNFNPKWINVVLVILFLSNLFINIDMGVLPASSLVMKEELGIKNAKFGGLGSVVHLG